ncbi:MAG: diacylglycerol/lipid kinase family protein [Hyphomicrobium sp.]
MRIHAIVNDRAGGALGQDLSTIEAAIKSPFERHGHEIVVEFSPPEKLAARIEAAAKRDVDVVIVGGGDGTVRTGAQIAIANGKTLGILPLGTLNRMARDLGIPLDVAEAAAALAAGATGRIDVASVNGHLYLCNSLIGLPPVYSAERQRLRGRPWRERMTGYAQVIKSILSSRKRLRVAVDDGSELRPLRVLSMAVANNAYCEQPGIGLTRPVLDGGELAVYASRHRSGWGMARALVRAILGRWSGDPHLEQFRGRNITVRVARNWLRVSNDGELQTLSTPLRYKTHPKALSVLLPARQN